MASHKSHPSHPDGVQLVLDLPGFDFTPPAEKPEAGDKKAMPQVADSAAGQLTIKLDS